MMRLLKSWVFSAFSKSSLSIFNNAYRSLSDRRYQASLGFTNQSLMIGFFFSAIFCFWNVLHLKGWSRDLDQYQKGDEKSRIGSIDVWHQAPRPGSSTGKQYDFSRLR
jgi:hypothetical protein